MKTSENINEISKAMSLAQGEMKPASKSTVNPFFKSTYASLSQVMDSIREPFAKNNLCIFQDVQSTDHGISVSTRVCHASGQWIEFGPMEVPLTKKDAQGVGSATSYGKRYSLSAAVGVVSDVEDDDGEGAMPKDRDSKARKEPKPDASPVIDYDKRKVLNNLADQCDPKYMATLYGYIKSQGVDGFEKLTESLYPKILKGMTQNAEVYKGENV